MKQESLSALARVARAALLAGGKIVRRGSMVDRQIHYKTSTSPVTQVDLASEKAIFTIIKKAFPTHEFLAEESAYIKGGTLGRSRPDQYRWVVDPLDGTVNFIHRIPQSCVSVAVERGGRVLAGGVYDPFRGELFFAVRGQGATMNGRKIRVSQETKMIRSLLVTGFPYDHHKKADFHAGLLKPFLEKMADVRRFGAAALDLSWVACGRVDAYWEFSLNPWDIAAGWLLVEEAGGRVSDFQGKPMNLDHPEQTMASNGRLHPQVTRLFLKTNLTKS